MSAAETLSPPAGQSVAASSDRAANRLAIVVCIGILLAGCWLRWIALTSAGGMWRDEAHSLRMAADHSKPLIHDSFPVLWLGSLRIWLMIVGPTADEFILRLWGAFTGILLIAAALWAPGLRRTDPPAWAATVLLALHPVVVVFGGQTRGYALGVAFGLLMSGCLARLVLLGETRLRWVAALLASVAAVQSSYTNSAIAAGVIGAGVLLHLIRRRPAAALRVLAIGLIAAATVVPYIFTAFAATKKWAVMVKSPYGLPHYVTKIWEAVAQAGNLTGVLWIVGIGAVVVTLVVLLSRTGAPQTRTDGNPAADGMTEPESLDRVLYATLALVIGTAAVLAYHKFLSVPTQVWYQLPVLALWTFTIDLVWPIWLRGERVRRLAILAMVVLAVWNTWLVSTAARYRLTNMDLVAKLLEEKVAADDLIVVRPFYTGISFARYYHGSAPWMTIPDMPPSQMPYGYIPMKEVMATEEQVDGDLDRIARHLAGGGRVWIVSHLAPLGEGEDAGRLPAAPNSPYGWSEAAYELFWSRQLTDILRRNASAIGRYYPGVDYPINPFEHQPVFEVRGRRAEAIGAVSR